jgi:hypothetical protein
MTSDESDTEIDESSPNLAVVTTVVFATVTLLAGTAYVVMFNIVNWVALDLLSYSADGAEPFVIITGAILTIPIVIPTVLVAVRTAE